VLSLFASTLPALPHDSASRHSPSAFVRALEFNRRPSQGNPVGNAIRIEHTKCYLGRKNLQLSENKSVLDARWWYRDHRGLTPKGQPKNLLEGISQAPAGVGLSNGHPCGAERDRTDDLRLAKPALSQLSYSPEKSAERRRPPAPTYPRLVWGSGAPRLTSIVGRGRLELPTSRLSGVRSNHLSYRPEGRLRLSPGATCTLRRAGWRLTRRPKHRLAAHSELPRSLKTESYDHLMSTPA
jgi:hypothetical protein